MTKPITVSLKALQLFRWASETGAHSMPHPDELRWLGYVPVLRHGVEVTDPRYPGSLLMRRDG